MHTFRLIAIAVCVVAVAPVLAGTTAAVGDHAWHDANDNGRQDDGERAIEGLAIQLLDADGAILQEETTDSLGRYGFQSLEIGATYRLRAIVPPGWELAAPDVTDDLLDSDFDPITGETPSFTLGAQSDDALRWDVGVRRVTFGGRVWHDLDGDGVQDDGEPGLAGVDVHFTRSSFSETMQTDDEGNFQFTFPAETYNYTYYSLRAELPGFAPTLPHRGDPAADSDATVSGFIQVRTIPLRASYATDLDIGLVEEGTFVGGFVWSDRDVDGRFDDESVVVGHEVTLTSADGATVLEVQLTGHDGRYRFANLTPGAEYRLRFDLPDQHFFTIPGGGNPTNDSDVVDPVTGETDPFVLDFPEPEAADDFYAGIVRAGAGDRLWVDGNRDGIQEGYGGAAYGFTLELLNTDDVVVATTVTDDDGRYFLPGTIGERYAVRVVLPEPYEVTLADRGEDDTLDSDFDPITRRTPYFVLNGPERAGHLDVGIYRKVHAIGGDTWLDVDYDGDARYSAPAVPGVTVQLFDADGALVGTRITDAGGEYQFDGLEDWATYVVRFTRPPDKLFTFSLLAPGYPWDSDPDPLTGEATVVLTQKHHGYSIDAGFVVPRIGGRAFIDADADGIQDDEEVGYRGVSVRLYDGAGTPVATTATDVRGEYAFTFAGLVPYATYRLGFVLPAGTAVTAQDATDDALDSDADASGFTAPFVLQWAGDALNWDIGLVLLPVRIGGRAWMDTDGDGTQDEGEVSLDGITVELRDPAGTTLATLETGPTGYTFEGLAPYESYGLRFSGSPGFVRTIGNVGADDTVDSDADAATGETETFVLDSLDDEHRWDAGYRPLFSTVGDRVWDDLNGDGIQDPEEPGLPNVRVDLVADAGDVLQSATSDADGDYRFEGVVPYRTYRLRVMPTFGQRLVPVDAGTDDRLDSDVDPATGLSQPFVFSSEEDALQWDVGIEVGRLAVGDRTWEDTDGNGAQDPGEPPLAYVPVELHDENGMLGAITSAADGTYRFGNLFPGQRLRLTFGPMGGFVRTTRDAANDDEDSDAHYTSGQTDWFVLDVDGGDATRWDAGYVPTTAAAGDRVWKDANGNGLQDPREPGIAGVQVLLFRSTGQVVGIRETDANGGYRFGGLFAAAHYVHVTAPAGFRFTTQDAPDDGSPGGGVELDERDSDVSTTTGRTATFTPLGQADATRWDAGLVHACPFPDAPLTIVEVEAGFDGSTQFVMADPNDPTVVTGFRARSSALPDSPIATWAGEDFTGTVRIWEHDIVLEPGGILFFQFSALNDACSAEGPW